jgi:hypothetical protein
LDALLSSGTFASFAYLSQSERFQRKWPSRYAAVEDGQRDTAAVRPLLINQLPQKGMCFFALDELSWARPRSRVLKDLQYVHQASSDVDGGHITIGYPYAALAWGAEAHTSWSLPVDVQRIPGKQTAQDVGVAQIQTLAKARAECTQALDIVAADGKYGNGRFLSRVSGLRGGNCGPFALGSGVFTALPNPRRANADVPPSMASALPSKTNKPGVHPTKCRNSRMNTMQGTPETLEWTAGQAGSEPDL